MHETTRIVPDFIGFMCHVTSFSSFLAVCEMGPRGMLGGLLMGYGARLAYGCNIGAYLGGLASGSAHGWAWAIMAFAGSCAAISFRKKIGF